MLSPNCRDQAAGEQRVLVGEDGAQVQQELVVLRAADDRGVAEAQCLLEAGGVLALRAGDDDQARGALADR